MQKTKDIINFGKPVKKTKLPMISLCYSGYPFKLNEDIHYIIYELNDEIAYKQVSKEEYNKIDI